MKIQHKDSMFDILSYINNGECFRFENEYYIKTSHMDAENNISVVRLNDGQLYGFNFMTRVEPVVINAVVADD